MTTDDDLTIEELLAKLKAVLSQPRQDTAMVTDAKSLAPAEQTTRRTKDELLKELESLLVDAGEICPYDYQSEFDWGIYNQMITEVKQLFIEHCSELGHMTKDTALRLVRAYADVVPPDDHIRTMPDRMTDHSLGKAMRWLGYVQGVLVERGVFTLTEVKEHSRRFSNDPNVHSLEGLTPLERRVGKREFGRLKK